MKLTAVLISVMLLAGCVKCLEFNPDGSCKQFEECPNKGQSQGSQSTGGK